MRPERRKTPVRSVVRRLSGATLGIGLAFVGVEAAQNPDIVADTYYHMTDKRTATEETLTTALRDAFGLHVSVRCAPIAEQVKHNSAAGDNATASVGRLWFKKGHVVRVTENICSAASTIVGRELPFPADSKELKEATNAARVLAHEGQHIDQDEKDEPKVECYA
ncbi:MAG: hypothetical protein AAB834_04370, partial [Patescibacteria group bacterium]